MNKYTLTAFIAVTVPLLLYSAEPSAFGAGDLNNPQPYGLTTSERVILENKKKLHKVQIKSNNQANEVDSLRERLDGLQSIIESLSRKAHNNKVNLAQLNEQNMKSSESADEYEKRLSSIIEENSQNIKKLNLVIPELSKLVDSINENYVSKDEFNTLVSDINKFKALMAKELSSSTKTIAKKSSFESMSNAEVAKKAKAFYNKQYYTDAIKHYDYLIEKNYKPAFAHYMIGEMNYKRKNYATAISYFKKSASLYKKASYMPNLMLHTAISMRNTGDEKNAQAFFNGVISKYPDSKEAAEAQKYLN